MKSYNLLVITPATVRPMILSNTLISFNEYLFLRDYNENINVQLAIHIDPVGEENRTMLDVTLTAKRHMKIDWIYKNYEEQHSLIRAFRRLWEYAAVSDFDYIFYLEDDWQLLRLINLQRMIDLMEKYPNLATLRLPFRPTAEKWSKNWRHLFPWNGDYFYCPEEDKPHIGWCGHPNIVRKKFVYETAMLLHPNECPERQMKGFWANEMSQIIMKWDYGVYGYPNEKEAIRDIGRQWRNEHNIIKEKDTSWRIA